MLSQSLDHELLGHESGRESTAPVDFKFLEDQTFGETELIRELLALFIAQAARILPTMPDLPPKAQADAAHLLKGSARGVGAWRAARTAAAYESTEPGERALVHAELTQAFAAATQAIEVYLS